MTNEDRSAFTPEVRERLNEQRRHHASQADYYALGGQGKKKMAEIQARMAFDLAAALTHIDALKARVAVLAAECRASRHNDECANYCTAGVGPRHDEDEWADASTTLKAARAATDANGGLDG